MQKLFHSFFTVNRAHCLRPVHMRTKLHSWQPFFVPFCLQLSGCWYILLLHCRWSSTIWKNNVAFSLVNWYSMCRSRHTSKVNSPVHALMWHARRTPVLIWWSFFTWSVQCFAKMSTWNVFVHCKTCHLKKPVFVAYLMQAAYAEI